MTEVAPPSQVAHRLFYLIRHSTLDDLVEELSLISPQDSLSCSDFHLSLLLSVPIISTTTRDSYHCIATFCLLLEKGINPFVEKGSDGKLLEWELEEVKNGVLRDIFRAEWEEGERCWNNNESYELPQDVAEYVETEVVAAKRRKLEALDRAEASKRARLEELDRLLEMMERQAAEPPVKRPRLLSPLPDYEEAFGHSTSTSNVDRSLEDQALVNKPSPLVVETRAKPGEFGNTTSSRYFPTSSQLPFKPSPTLSISHDSTTSSIDGLLQRRGPSTHHRLSNAPSQASETTNPRDRSPHFATQAQPRSPTFTIPEASGAPSGPPRPGQLGFSQSRLRPNGVPSSARNSAEHPQALSQADVSDTTRSRPPSTLTQGSPPSFPPQLHSPHGQSPRDVRAPSIDRKPSLAELQAATYTPAVPSNAGSPRLQTTSTTLPPPTGPAKRSRLPPSVKSRLPASLRGASTSTQASPAPTSTSLSSLPPRPSASPRPPSIPPPSLPRIPPPPINSARLVSQTPGEEGSITVTLTKIPPFVTVPILTFFLTHGPRSFDSIQPSQISHLTPLVEINSIDPPHIEKEEDVPPIPLSVEIVETNGMSNPNGAKVRYRRKKDADDMFRLFGGKKIVQAMPGGGIGIRKNW